MLLIVKYNMELKNIKVRFIFEKDVVIKPTTQLIWKNEEITFSIYKDATNFINVTRLKNLQQIEQQKLLMEECFKQKIIETKIDNTFFSKKDHKNIDMCSLYNYLKGNKDYFCNYNIELFAGMYLHPSNKIYPTILLFRTGSYTLMGGKSIKAIYESEYFVKNLVHKFKK